MRERGVWCWYPPFVALLRWRIFAAARFTGARRLSSWMRVLVGLASIKLIQRYDAVIDKALGMFFGGGLVLAPPTATTILDVKCRGQSSTLFLPPNSF